MRRWLVLALWSVLAVVSVAACGTLEIRVEYPTAVVAISATPRATSVAGVTPAPKNTPPPLVTVPASASITHPAGTPSPTVPTPPAAFCTDEAQFVADVTIPDNAVIAPGALFVKTWRMKNTGACVWNSSYAFVALPNSALLGAPTSVAVTGQVTPGSLYNVSVSFIAPDRPGTYISRWRLKNAAGEAFGSTPYVQIQVVGGTLGVSPTPNLISARWGGDPTLRILRYYSPYTTAGLAGAYSPNYYIPEVQVWGDGRIVWVVREGDARRVLEGYLTPEQLQALLQRLIEAGFFNWNETYEALGGNSTPPMFLEIALIGQTKLVSEHGGAPEAFYPLRDFLLTGAGALGEAYMPKLGYLTAHPFAGAVTAEAQWPEALFPLDQVGQGRFVDGEALSLAWQAVNRHPTTPIYVQSNNQIYTIMVQIPGLSFFEPPAQ